MAVFAGFVGEAYTADALVADAQTSVNLYLEAIESGDGQNTAYLRLKPGIAIALTLPTQPVRGLWSNDTGMYAVAGNTFYQIFSNNTYNARGTVANDGLPAYMFANGSQLLIVSGGHAYCDNGAGPVAAAFSATKSFTCNTVAAIFPFGGSAVTWVSGDTFTGLVAGMPITINAVAYTIYSVPDATHLSLTGDAGVQTGVAGSTPSPVLAKTGAFLDGYFIVNPPASTTIQISAINDGVNWTALDFALKEGYPDHVAAVFADHEEVWLFGTDTTEVWQDTGAASFPLARIPGGFIHHGCAAFASPCRVKNGVGWLVSEPNRGGVGAVIAQGFIPTRVSTHALETEWASYSTIADAVSSVYSDGGHEHWCIDFPTANKRWVYDTTAGKWHRRAWWNGASQDRDRWSFHCKAFGKHYVGDWESGKLYILDSTTYTDDGVAIHWERAAPHLSTEGRWSFYHEFKALMQAPIGAVVTLDWARIANDGTLTWATARSKTVAATMRFIWRRLGKSRDRIFRLSGAATGKTAIANVFLDVEQGNG